MGYIVIGPDGKLPLPKAVQDQLGLKPGDSVRIDVDPDQRTVALSSGVGALTLRRIVIGRSRVSMRLESSIWDSLEDIGRREGLSVNKLCTSLVERIEEQLRRSGVKASKADVTLTAAVRVFVAVYYRHHSTEAGHIRAGHGTGDPFIGTPFELPSMNESAETRPDSKNTIEDLIGMGGRCTKPVTPDDMNSAIRRRAAERFFGR